MRNKKSSFLVRKKSKHHNTRMTPLSSSDSESGRLDVILVLGIVSLGVLLCIPICNTLLHERNSHQPLELDSKVHKSEKFDKEGNFTEIEEPSLPLD